MVAMTKAEAISRIQQGLGWRDDKDTEITLELRLVQDLLEKGQSLPPWLLAGTGYLTGTANQEYIALPTGFIRFDEDLEFSTTDSDGVLQPVTQVDYRELLQLGQDPVDGSTETGRVKWVALRWSRLYVRPVPTSSFTITCDWYAADEDIGGLASSGTNNWLTYGHDILLGKAGQRMAQDLHNDKAERNFTELYQTGQARLLTEIAMRKQNARRYRVGARR